MQLVSQRRNKIARQVAGLAYSVKFYQARHFTLLTLLKDACSGMPAVSTMDLVFPTRKKKPFHDRVSGLGLGTDAKLKWVIIIKSLNLHAP